MSHTDSLFDQMDMSPDVPMASADRKIVHDTQTIMDIYMSRPKSITYQSLGLWFSKAHMLREKGNLHWKELENFGIFSILTKRFLVLHRLTELPLEPLEAYNKAWTDKEAKK
jgi:hypothetical protein